MVVLELGKAGSAGTEKGVLPVLRDGAVVATLRASNWKEAATAVVGDRSWVFGQEQAVTLTARWAAEPEDAVRLRASRSRSGRAPGPSTWRDAGGGADRVALEGHAPVPVGGRQVAESGTTGGGRRGRR